ncbi:hypothetical protein [Aeromonas diversa]|uniref:Uncharacterized protein n=1 Tax=Aeromonas diversa CDC 2478-85 TaxID=1268237 RepID=N9U3E4_9GAMM|nr:hypothetical protein [Aeromonas diversa]ENY72845.1 hypothetical protein G114_05445 [Aeromonas diversa CDC 2478-85]
MKGKMALLALLLAAPAMAFHCPADMKKIDDLLAQKPALNAGDLAKVKALRAEGEKLHKAGQHQASVDKLAEALKLLGQ